MGDGERTEIGQVPEGGLTDGENNGSVDPEGGNTPEGERKLRAQSAESGGNAATGLSEEAAETGANRNWLWSGRQTGRCDHRI